MVLGLFKLLKFIVDGVFILESFEGYEVGATNLEKINILNAINFINAAWNIDAKTTTIANCFQHYKIWSNEGIAIE